VLAVAELPAQAVAVAVAMPVNFVGNKLWTFD
jgi:putative flippase GtrA